MIIDDVVLETAQAIVDGPGRDRDDAHDGQDSRLSCLRLIATIASGHRFLLSNSGGAASVLDTPTSVEGLRPGTTWGPLQVLERAGAGSYGEVYRAYDRRLDCEVALKLSSRSWHDTDRFVSEARRLASVKHPNVVAVRGADVIDGRGGLWTDFVRGTTLEALLDADRSTGETEVITTGISICRGLGAVHDAGFVHGDVKAANVMRDRNGRVRVLDFGAATEAINRNAGLTGTPLALAPEILLDGSTSPAADIYSLGVLLFRLLTKRYPVEASNLDELLQKHREGARVSLRSERPRISRELEGLLGSLLASSPTARPQSCEAVAEALGQLLPARGVEVRARDDDRLPRPETPLVGRARECREVRDLLNESRLVTLTGPGGVGKTRVAIGAIPLIRSAFPDGIQFFDLTSITDSSLLPDRIAQVIGLGETSNTTPDRRLIEHLGDRSCLLVLDNCEHVAGACGALVSRLLQACPKLRIVATSREPLRTPAETLLRITPLETPHPGIEADSVRVADHDAARLFIERAREFEADFSCDPETASHIARICRRVEGVPLAIELAAARLESMSVRELSVHLEDSFDLGVNGDVLTSGLDRVLDWSLTLLPARERELLLDLSVFVGGWTLEAAESITRTADGDVCFLLDRLHEKSLVVRERSGDEWDADIFRYRLLETTRQFLVGRFEQRAEHRTVARRHRAHFVAFVREAMVRHTGRDQAPWLTRVDVEYPNILGAVDHAMRTRNAQAAENCLQIARSLSRYWSIRARWSEAARVCDLALSHGCADRESALFAMVNHSAASHAKARGEYELAHRLYDDSMRIYESIGDDAGLSRVSHGLATLLAYQGHYGDAERLLERSVQLARQLDDPFQLSTALSGLCDNVARRGDSARAQELMHECLSIQRARGDQHGIGNSLATLGLLLTYERRFEEAGEALSEALRLRREAGAPMALAVVLNNTGVLAGKRGDLTEAKDCFDECLSISREIHFQLGIGASLNNLGRLAQSAGRLDRAAALHREALDTHADLDSDDALAETLSLVAALAARRGVPGRGAQLLAASQEMFRRIGRVPLDREEIAAIRSRLLAILDEEEYERESTLGRSLTTDQAVALARQLTD